jgi:outer membrane protein
MFNLPIETAMHYFRALIVAAALCGVLIPVHASAETRIATIRSLELLRDAPQIKAANERMKNEFQKQQQQIENDGRRLSDDIKKFQREADTLSAQQRANTEKDLNTRKIDFEYKQRQLAEQVQAREQELRMELQAKFAQAIEEVAKEKGIQLVLQDPVYAAAGIDITEEVLKRLGTQDTKGGRKR